VDTRDILYQVEDEKTRRKDVEEWKKEKPDVVLLAIKADAR
jgi:hypothetical protein